MSYWFGDQVAGLAHLGFAAALLIWRRRLNEYFYAPNSRLGMTLVLVGAIASAGVGVYYLSR